MTITFKRMTVSTVVRESLFNASQKVLKVFVDDPRAADAYATEVMSMGGSPVRVIHFESGSP